MADWRANATAFETALRDGWRDHRLAPHLFNAADRVRKSGLDAVRPFGSADLLPTEWLTSDVIAGLDHIAREWGREIALAEVRELFTSLEARSRVIEQQGDLAEQVREARASSEGRSSRMHAIFAPARWRILRALELDREPAPAEIPGTPRVVCTAGASRACPCSLCRAQARPTSG